MSPKPDHPNRRIERLPEYPGGFLTLGDGPALVLVGLG